MSCGNEGIDTQSRGWARSEEAGEVMMKVEEVILDFFFF